ncbi:MAG: TetR/AcrR family transcriptional regulator [Anaerolineales bacterium]|nr:TetR/AcrR family transcriptional regulator [Anaerolineales bacterium]
MELTERTVRNNIMVQRSTKNGRRRILEAAETLFTEQGFNAVSIRDIAERCEVTNAALYYHFPSKAALYEEVLEQHAQRLDDRMRAAVHKEGTYRDRLKVMLLEYAKITKGRRPPFHLLRRDINGIDKVAKIDCFRRIFHAMILPIEELLAEAIKAGDLKQLPEGFSSAAILIGMGNGQIQFSHACGKKSIGIRELDYVVDIFWEGLGVEDNERRDKY